MRRIRTLQVFLLWMMLLFAVPAFANTIANPTTLSLGSPVTDVLNATVHTIYYQFTITDPSYVNISFTHASTGNGNNGWYSTVESADGLTSYLYTAIPGTSTITSQYVGLPAGTYVIVISQGTASSDVPYTLKVDASAGNYEQEKNDKIDKANPIAVGTPYTGNMEVLPSGSDVDYYKFTIDQPSYVSLNFNHASNGNGNNGWYTTIQSADGLTDYLYTGIPGTATSTTKYVGLAAGTYMVKVAPGNGGDLDYTLTVNATAGNYEQEKNDSIATANVMALGTPYTGNLEALTNGDIDVDYYKFTIDQPSYVSIKFNHASNGNGNNGWYTTIQSADGLTDYLYTGYPGTATSITKYVGLAAGTYLVKVTPGNGGDQDYTLTVNATTGNYEQEKNDTIATATSIALGTPYTGNIGVQTNGGTDLDYYRFTITQPSYVSLNFNHASNGNGNNGWYTTIQSADGLTDYLYTGIPGTATSTTKYVGLAAGTYIVKVAPGNGGDMDYTLTVNATAGNYEQEKNDTPANATPIALGTAYTGNIGAQSNGGTDLDYYRFTITQPSYVSLNFNHASNGNGNSGWYTTIQSADGLTDYLYTGIPGTATSTTKYVGLAAGTYLVKVAPGNGGDMDYTLTVNATAGNYEQEKNDTIATATPMAFGTAYTGNIGGQSNGGTDVDYYRFSVANGGNVNVSFVHPLINNGNSFWKTSIVSADGITTYPVVDIAGTATSTTKTVALPAGSYVLLVTQGTYSDDRDYTVMVTTAPGDPSTVAATGGNAQATVSFTAPASTGGSAVTSYTVTSIPDGKTATGTASPLTVTGLSNGTAYTFTVTAANAVGTGPASTASNSVTPLPPVPTISGDPATTVTVGSPYYFAPTATDATSFTIINKPSWALFDTSTGILSGQPVASDVGTTNNIVISAINSAGAALKSFSITVAPSPNHAPVISKTHVVTLNEGAWFSFTPIAVDADGDPLSFSVINKPDWASFDGSTGTLSGAPVAGTYSNIQISVSDGKASASLPAFTINVVKPGDLDGSGSVSIAEVQRIINAFLGLPSVMDAPPK